jgi:hypothetical protein
MPVAWNGLDPETLYTKIRMINGAFTGPIDTLSFARGLHLTAVRALDEVPFLRLDSSVIKMEIIPVWAEDALEPEQFHLEQNFPNPFNPTTTIEFYLVEPSFVTLKLYNTLGQEVATLLNREELEDGWQETELEAGYYNLSSGVYYYRLTAETITDEDNPNGQKVVLTKKMVLVK